MKYLLEISSIIEPKSKYRKPKKVVYGYMMKHIITEEELKKIQEIIQKG